LGEVRRAIEFYEQQLVIVREIGDRRGEGSALGNSALAYEQLDNRAKAIELAQQALAIFEQIENPNVEKVRRLLKRLQAS
ncbi:MAG: tetratricopeptide repeat protein, partial [Phycisphaerae bacterium]|nr:tetratricopeptide repeat protein [Phycisphaerae bacterium]